MRSQEDFEGPSLRLQGQHRPGGVHTTSRPLAQAFSSETRTRTHTHTHTGHTHIHAEGPGPGTWEFTHTCPPLMLLELMLLEEAQLRQRSPLRGDAQVWSGVPETRPCSPVPRGSSSSSSSRTPVPCNLSSSAAGDGLDRAAAACILHIHQYEHAWTPGRQAEGRAHTPGLLHATLCHVHGPGGMHSRRGAQHHTRRTHRNATKAKRSARGGGGGETGGGGGRGDGQTPGPV